MKIKIPLLVVLALLLTYLPAQAQEDLAEWTVMLYAAADTDLEPFMLVDVNEMEAVGSTDDVHMVVQIDRAAGHTDMDGDWTEARRYYLTQDGNLEVINSEMVASLGEIFQVAPAEVADFAIWAMQNYPAKRYAFILSDHGAGIMGFGNDDSEDGRPIFPHEIDQALAQITNTTGETFELIGFDACLMAQFDILRVLAPYAHYALLAEETEPGNGWAYDVFLGALVENPQMDGAELGRVVIDSYMQFYTEIVTYYDKFDLNLLDLTMVPEVDAAMAAFAQAVQNNGTDALYAVGAARGNAQYFGGATPDQADEISSVDLLHFLHLLIQLTDNEDVKIAAQDLSDAVSQVVVYNQANEGLPNARGIAIYFPRNARVYEEMSEYYPILVPQMADWKTFLDAFSSAAIEALPPVDTAVTKIVEILGVYPPGTLSIHNPPAVLFSTNGKDIAQIGFAATLDLGDGVYITVDESSLESATYTEEGEQINVYPDGLLYNQFAWGVEMPVITDGIVDAIPVLLLETGDPDTVAVSGIYTYKNTGQEREAFLQFDLETQEVQSVFGVSAASGEGAAGAPFEISVTPGDTFLPTWRFFDDSGAVEIIPANSDPLTFGDTPFIFDYMPAESGDYTITIWLEDMAGNVYFDETDVTVDNEGLDSAYRGLTDANFGITFLYPWGWPESYDVETEDGGTRTELGNPEETIYIYLNYLEVDSPDAMLDAALEYVTMFEDVEYDEPEDITLGGYDGHVIYYLVSDEQGAYEGTTLAVYVPENATGYLIDVLTSEDAGEEGWEVLDTIIESLNFYTPAVLPDEESATSEFGSVAEVFAAAGYTEEEMFQILEEGFEISLEELEDAVAAGEVTLEELYQALAEAQE